MSAHFRFLVSANIRTELQATLHPSFHCPCIAKESVHKLHNNHTFFHEQLIVLHPVNKFIVSMEPQCSSLGTQNSASGPYHEPA
jgi:hypothetical protein